MISFFSAIVSTSLFLVNSAHSRVESVSQAVGEQVEGDHQNRNQQRGEQGLVRIMQQNLLSVGEQNADGGFRRLQSQADKGQEGFGEDRIGNLDHRFGDDGTDGVGENMTENQRTVAHTQSSGRQNIFPGFEAEELGTDVRGIRIVSMKKL